MSVSSTRARRQPRAMTTHERTLEEPQATPGVLEAEQQPLTRSVALHLIPGLATAAAFYALAPAVVRAGYPAISGAVLAVGVVLVGIELGWLLREAHRRTGSWSIVRVLPYRPGAFTWRKGLLVVGLVAWAFAVSLLGIGGSIRDSFFSWMPQWALNPLPAGFADTGSSTAKVVTAAGYVLVLVILGPLVEELYFRGYLLPRLDRFGAWAALINVSLFALYHLWKPWDVINLVIILGPMVYAVWRLRDIRIGIAAHIALNSLALINVAPVLLFD